MNSLKTLLVLVAFGLCTPTAAFAVEVLWNNPLGGDFLTDGNWGGSLSPDSDDVAVFDLATSGYVVTLGQASDIAGLAVRNDRVTLDLGGSTISLGTGSLPQSAFIGADVGSTSLLTLSSGTIVTPSLGIAALDGAANATGEMRIIGPTSIVSLTSAVAETIIGLDNGDEGTLGVYDGGSLVGPNSTIDLGRAGGSGTLVVSGVGSNVEAGQLIVGTLGHGELTIGDNASVVVNGFVGVANQDASPSGMVIVESGGEFQTGQFLIGGSGMGELVIRGGGKVDSLASLTTTGRTGVIGARTSTAHGSVTITGAGSEWTQDGTVLVGALGSASLRVESQGYASALDAIVARDTTSVSEVEVHGAGSHWEIDRSLFVGGNVDIAGGTATVAAMDGGRITAGELLHVWNSGTVDVSQGGSVEVGTVTTAAALGTMKIGSGGTLSGTGTLIGDVIVDGGTVSPGASPGSLIVDGNYHQLSSGRLLLEIGGTNAGLDYDQLLVSGELQIDGDIEIEFINEFVPQAGNVFELFGGTSVFLNGSVTFLNAPADFAYSSSFANGIFSVTVVPEPTSLVLVIGGLLLGAIWRRSNLRTC